MTTTTPSTLQEFAQHFQAQLDGLQAQCTKLQGEVDSLTKAYHRSVKRRATFLPRSVLQLAANRFNPDIVAHPPKKVKKGEKEKEKGKAKGDEKEKAKEKAFSLDEAWRTIQVSIKAKGSWVYKLRLRDESDGFDTAFVKLLGRIYTQALVSQRNSEAHLEDDPLVLLCLAFECEYVSVSGAVEASTGLEFADILYQHCDLVDAIITILGTSEATTTVQTIVSGQSDDDFIPHPAQVVMHTTKSIIGPILFPSSAAGV